MQDIGTPFFIAGAANDNWFYPPAVSQTLMSMKGETNLLFAPNNSHKIELPGGTKGKAAEEPGWLSMERLYFEYHLKGKGNPLPKIVKIETVKMKNGNSKIRFKVTGPVPFESANVCYSPEGADWPKRVWEIVTATDLKNGWYEAEIPTKDLKRNISCFASISDTRPVTVSSKIVTIK